MKYIVQAQLKIEVEAETPEKAQEKAVEKFKEIEKLDATVSDAKVVDQKTGYFIK